MKLSICTCAINAAHEIDRLVRFLNTHNDPSSFEVSLVLDDRTDDGSPDVVKKLADQYPNFKYVTHTKADTEAYLDACVAHYERNNIFTKSLVDGIKDNIVKFKQGTLFDPTRTFLWISSGVLYNRAVGMSTGDVLYITPVDFLPLFPLNALRKFYAKETPASSVLPHPEQIYIKPNAIFARVTNMDPIWLESEVKKIHGDPNKARPNYRWDSVEPLIDYFRYPSELGDFNLPDFQNNRLINLTDKQFYVKVKTFCENSMVHGVQVTPNFHGVHIMHRKLFRKIGGFSEEFYGRAFADDKMTHLGMSHGFQICAPAEISFAWLYNGELAPSRGPGYPSGWQEELKKKDKYWGKHPVQPFNPVYLHEPYANNSTMNLFVNGAMNRHTKPVRLMQWPESLS